MKRKMSDKAWKTYEEVAIFLLNQFAQQFDLEIVEGKQKILTLRSNSKWEIDGKAITKDKNKFLIVECRRYTTSKVKQEGVAGLAYKITNTGASGGIIVTPIGLQKGGLLIANSENIIPVILNEKCSSTEYMMRYLNQINIGIGGKLTFNGKLNTK